MIYFLNKIISEKERSQDYENYFWYMLARTKISSMKIASAKQTPEERR